MLYQQENPHGGDVYARPVRLDFSSNTNPWGPPQGVLAVVANALPRLHQYPDPYCRDLVRAISAWEGVPEARILCGNGAAELIYAYCQALRPATAVVLAPTFSEYAQALEAEGCQVTGYPLRKEAAFALDAGFLDFLEAQAPEAVFLCSPNNPTGRCIPSPLLGEILGLCRRRQIRLFLDECFLDLAQGGESLRDRLAENPHLFLLKALTKNFALAGLRLGYGLSGDASLLADMAQKVSPWNVSLLAQAAGAAALRERDFLETTRQKLWEERAWLAQALRELGFWVCPSQANFLLFSAPPGLRRALLEQGIAIRSCHNYQGLGPGWYRVAVRRHEENQQLLSAMADRKGRG